MLTQAQLDASFSIQVENSRLELTFLLNLNVKNKQDILDLAIAVKRSVETILNSNPTKQYKALIDLSLLEKNDSYIPQEARRIYRELMTSSQIAQMAFHGDNQVHKVVVNFLAASTGNKLKYKWFTAKEQAIAWLNL